ncbi:MAG TPA: nuclear transport factor 2 family protein, partial [Kofleriaceae bacterium]|nr:nuclear transport factor 2 family protein [Kofleriaceae bacterium]
MRNDVRWIVVIGLSLVAASGTAFGESSEASKRTVVERFFHLREKMLDQRGAPADVDDLVSLLTEKAVYEHPVAKVSMSKADVRAGMIAHLKEGRDAKLTLRRVLIGADFAVVETTLHYSLP